MYAVEDASGMKGVAEELFAPATEEELSALLRDASSRSIPVTVAGARTGVAGGCVPDGGWLISLERFSAVQIHAGYAVAQAGLPLKDLQAAAAVTRQFYAPDPTEHTASVGGSIATNASGSRSFLYGDTRRHVLAIRVALMDGAILDLERGLPVPFDVPELPLPATNKFAAGFPLRPGMDYLDLFIGSEGTLGVVTSARLTLLPSPGELLAGVVFFRGDDDALNAVDAWRTVPGLRMLEYMDAGSLNLLRARFPTIPAEASACLLIEDETADVDAWIDRLDETNALGEASWFGVTDSERERFRVFRHALPEAVNDTVRKRGLAKAGTDFAVPVARNREMLAWYRTVLDEAFAERYVIFGHIGDAHVHCNMLPADPEEAARARELMTEMARKAVSLGGTVAAEHGLGRRKRHFLGIQWTPEQLEAMRAVKHRLDPQGLLGRGVLFPQPM